MSKKRSGASTKSIVAAGGIVLGAGENAGKIAIVRRRRYGGEIGLPKGKLRKGEEATDAALREVQEETGCRVKMRKYAGSTHYFVGTAPKTVHYFVMELDGPCDRGPKDTKEIEAVEWLVPELAVAVLTHREDRDFISTTFGLHIGKPK